MSRDTEDLVTVHKAYSEIEAISVRAMLESAGIEAAVRSRQIPMYDGIAKVYNPIWGYVQVLQSDLPRARRLVDEYLAEVEGDGE
ncbi:MAG: DUF2007 domain-containing protein [Candidatus Fermentibacteraceae bacterium]